VVCLSSSVGLVICCDGGDMCCVQNSARAYNVSHSAHWPVKGTKH
jgi:hypothetical protein